MLHRKLAAVLMGVMMTLPCVGQAKAPAKHPWSDAKLGPDQRADLLLKEMTLDEKLSMLHGQGMPFFATGPTESNGGAGYTNSIPRLGIPAIQMADSAYGVTRGAATGRYSTALPNNLGAASAWDADAAFEYGALIGRELRNQGYNMSLGGGLNLAREPRNGRTFEYAGEDPLLAGTLVGNLERGVQSAHVIGDVKHYALNDQESGRNALDVTISKRAMRETDLRAFEIALRISGAGAVMCSYNRVNGDYACENQYLLSDVLRKDWGFKGFVVSDWGATHSAAKALRAGLDQEQPSGTFFGAPLKTAVEQGKISQAEIDEHVHHVLYAMFANGLFDQPAVMGVPDVEAGYRTAQQIEEKSIVLLKNENHALPLAPGVRKILLVGGHADVGVPSGGGSAQVDPPGGSPVPPPPPGNDFLAAFIRPEWMPSVPLKALKDAVAGANISFVSGEDVQAAATAAKGADEVFVFADQWEAENSDLESFSLPRHQDALIEAVAAANPKTVVVLETGGPVTMPWVDHVAGIVEAWYPGIRGAEAVANVLTGKVNPSGKLAITFPRSEADLPHPSIAQPPAKSDLNLLAQGADISNLMSQLSGGLPPFPVRYDEGLKVGYAWFDAEHKPVLFPFGFGLSYTTYAYSGLIVKKTDAGLTVSFTVKNTGMRRGTEIAQVYVALPAGSGEPPKRLAGWARVALDAEESRLVSVEIGKDRMSIFDETADAWKLPTGEYVVRAGGSSQDLPLQQAVTF